MSIVLWLPFKVSFWALISRPKQVGIIFSFVMILRASALSRTTKNALLNPCPLSIYSKTTLTLKIWLSQQIREHLRFAWSMHIFIKHLRTLEGTVVRGSRQMVTGLLTLSLRFYFSSSVLGYEYFLNSFYAA